MATKLRAIDGQGIADEFGLLPQDAAGDAAPLESSLGHPILRRPGDHLETLWLDDACALKEVRAAAGRRRIHADTAAAVVLERRLVVPALGDPELVCRLNGLSTGHVPKVELWAAHSAYLTHLLHGARSPDLFAPSTPARLSIPIRLIDRLAGGLPPAIEPAEDELEHAIAWEIAALLSGETLGEWAYRSVIQCRSGVLPPSS
jgi:hypothetical protein